ncbi:putative amino-acid permease [Cladobotryum mycophilum]|uniref:Amino-acid permease n=1 Tax=Cladobotryum mycophilum TaxID=491253 RepID=A0ABR0STB2_9HYPO
MEHQGIHEKQKDGIDSVSSVHHGAATGIMRDFGDPTVQLEMETTHEGEFGTKRDLKPRHVSMIAIAGTIGTGLFLGSGASLVSAGPVGFFVGYSIVGCLVGMMMYCLGEMTVFSPNIGGFIEMGNKYISPEAGFAMGINYILQTGITIPAEITATAVMISYWDHVQTHVSAYIATFLALSIGINMLGVKYFGEIEFVFACIKVVTLVGLILFGLIADVGGIDGVYTGGRYWREEPFNDTYLSLTPVSLARFLGFWKVLTQAAFAFGGIEGLSVLAGEAHNPRKTMRTAVKSVFYRIVGLYLLTILMICLNVSQHSPELLDAVSKGGSTAASSPFVVICQQTGVRILPSIINAVVMTSAVSSCNENVFAVARTLLALARQGSMPRFFLNTSRFGTPYFGVTVSFCFGLLAFLSLSNGSNQVFIWLSNLSALSSLIAWISICVCFVRFQRSLEVQGIKRENLDLRGWCQPYMAWICIFTFTIILFFNGFGAFIHSFSVSTFFASYVTLPVVTLAFFGYRVYQWRGGRPFGLTNLQEINLSHGPVKALRGTKYDLGAYNI